MFKPQLPFKCCGIRMLNAQVHLELETQNNGCALFLCISIFPYFSVSVKLAPILTSYFSVIKIDSLML